MHYYDMKYVNDEKDVKQWIKICEKKQNNIMLNSVCIELNRSNL